MPWVVTTQLAGGTFGNTGKWFHTNPTGSSFVETALPTGVNAVDARPSFAISNGDAKSRMYAVGGWTDNLVFTENFNLMRQGILPPPNQIVNAAGSGNKAGLQASGTGITGTCIGYLAWWDDVNQRRSPLSGPSPTITLTNQGLAWDNLPTDPRDPSVTHIELWRAMNGTSPRLAVRRDLGTTSVTENIATGSLGEALTEDFTRFPRCRWNVMWHDRQVMAGDDRHPDRLYFSVLNEPERYAGLYLRTRRGEAIIGLISMRDQLIVLCAQSSYVVTGYTEDDLAMNNLEPEIGGISHHAVAHVHNWAIVPTHLGLYLCTGTSYHFISEDFQFTWVDEFEDNQDAYEDSWAVNDIESGVYKLWVGSHSLVDSPNKAYWILDYSPLIVELGGNFQQPHLSLDVRQRTDECAAVLRRPGAKRGHLYTGSCDGFIRRENDDANTNDDGDGFQKRMRIQTRHYTFGKPGGNLDEGFTFPAAWVYLVNEFNDCTINTYAGDDYANTYFVPSHSEPCDSGSLLDEDGNDLAPRSLYYWKPDIAGRGITFDLIMDAPQASVEWNGIGGTKFTGANDRARINDGGGV